MEHIDIDVGLQVASPNDLSTIQPVDLTSPMGAQKIPHQPITPQMNVAGAAGPKPGTTNFMMMNQR